VNKRPARTQGTKYGLKRVGLLGLLIMSDVEEGIFMSK
jgi:predicted nucleic acid-binding protein